MDSSTSISSHTNEITEDTGASSSFTNGALLEGRPLEVAISEIKTSSLLNMKEPPSGAEDEQNDNKLLKAAVSGNFSEIEQMVLQYPQILLKPTPQGSTCLHISSIFGKEKFCEDVLAQNQSLLTSLNNYRETPLIVAVKSGHVNLATTFLQMCKEQGLNEKTLISDINGDTALHHAIRQGHRELALKLIEAEPHLSRKVNKYNESPLYITVMRGFNDVFKGLWGTDRCSHKGPYDDNALHAAVRNDNIEIITTIMESRPELAKEKNKSGHTPIQYAVHRNQIKAIRKMLLHDRTLGYIVNSNQEGNPLLVSAASRGHIDVSREILEHCPDAPYRNKAGLTILHQAVIEGHVNYVEFILQNRQLDMLINMRDSDGSTALHHAVKSCKPKIVSALLDHKDIDVRIYDSEGRPAFWQLLEAKDSVKSLNWNEVFMLMSKADPQATTFYLRQVAMKKLTVKSLEEITLLTATYTKNTSLVAILIATITFAAAFTMPGGYSNDSGLPVMQKKFAFKAFLISDILAMCSSLAVAFICILARWEDLKFLLYYRSFTKKLMWFAYMATTVAFATGLYTVVAPRLLWLAILICILSVCLPFLTYLLGQWPILKLRYRLGPNFGSNFLNMV